MDSIFKFLLLLLFSTTNLWAYHEINEIYQSPMALSRGDTFMGEASGTAALFYNPACLQRIYKRESDYSLFALDNNFAFASFPDFYTNKSWGAYKVINHMKSAPGNYYYQQADVIPGVAKNGWGFALLGSSQVAGYSDGSNWMSNVRMDIVPTIGKSLKLAGGLVAIGATVKSIVRRELNGTFDTSTLTSASAVSAAMSEGYGFGADAGTVITLPTKWTPTLSFVWHDIGNTKFQKASHIFDSVSTGALPQNIPQSYNAGFSVHPRLYRATLMTIAVEYHHMERNDLGFIKRFHVGVEISDQKTVFFWFGASGIYPSFGGGLHLWGGNLDLGFYGADIGDGATTYLQPRTMLRYTIGF